ncbi:MAG: hypothetical protein OSB19_14840 [Opitutaceae bacterium]|nr:hypothetical protein [Opitutaceae bacterium]
MNRSLSIISLFLTLGFSGCQTASNLPLSSEKKVPNSSATIPPENSYLFGWGELPSQIATPRGGTSTGSSVEFAPPRALPLTAIANASSAFEKDRAAILSLAGDYKAGFHFLEMLGLLSKHEPARPYHSWATEKVLIVEDEETSISLQHILAMYFQDEDGTITGPMIMKHWRQDWTYQNTDFHTYRGDNTWARDTRSNDAVKGGWTQSVWQVDDSPRYQAFGHWTHNGNRSMWTGEQAWRPLPRREYSIRDDYSVMEGFHRILITPKGWFHEQNNWKRVAGDSEKTPTYVGYEVGIDRYELIESPSLEAASEYWEKTSPYWAEVRSAWESVFASNERFTLHKKVEGKNQFEHHFEYAGKIDEGEPFNQAGASGFARDIVQQYLAKDSEKTTDGY